MKVVLLSHYPNDDVAPAGGVWAVGRNLAAGMAAAGAEVHVVRYVAAPDRGRPRARVEGVTPLVVHTVEVPRQRTRPIRRLACVAPLAELTRALRPDAITAHESEYGLAALRSGLPAAITIHGVPRREFWAFRSWRGRADLALTVWQDTKMARQATDIVAIADYVVQQYCGRTRARFHRIDVPIGDVFFGAPDRAPDPKTLLLVGGMNERKDPLTLLRALSLVRRRPGLADVTLRIAGRVSEHGFGARLRGVIVEEGLQDNVDLLGSLNQPELALAYAASAVTVLSSRQETTPAVLMEAMAARRPVVATDVGGVREIVAEGESGFVVPAGDAPALAERIATLLTEPALADRMGRRGRELAEVRYRRSLVGEHYVALLESLAQTGTAAARGASLG